MQSIVRAANYDSMYYANALDYKHVANLHKYIIRSTSK